MLKRTKIPYYRDRIEATTPSRWEIILKGSFLD